MSLADAVRAATLLGLHDNPLEAGDFAEQEVRKRVFWLICTYSTIS